MTAGVPERPDAGEGMAGTVEGPHEAAAEGSDEGRAKDPGAPEGPDTRTSRDSGASEKPDVGTHRDAGAFERPDAGTPRESRASEKWDASASCDLRASEEPDRGTPRESHASEEPDAGTPRESRASEKRGASGSRESRASEKPDRGTPCDAGAPAKRDTGTPPDSGAAHGLDVGTAERVRRLLGSRVVAARAITDRGYAPNQRWVVRTAAGRSAFLKVARTPLTASWLRAEYAVYREVRADFLPELLGWDDDGAAPLLLLEDLSGAVWPPPWSGGAVDAVLRALDRVHATPIELPALDPGRYSETGWPEVARDPGPLLSLGLCSSAWLDRALPVLLATAEPRALAGTATLHLDVRSDNLCFRGGSAVLIDWNHAVRGDPQVDLGFWLPSLRAEGGPEPEAVADLAPSVVAHVAGYFAGRAGLPGIPEAPRVRPVQRAQLEVALPWVARVLDLPTPGV